MTFSYKSQKVILDSLYFRNFQFNLLFLFLNDYNQRDWKNVIPLKARQPLNVVWLLLSNVVRMRLKVMMNIVNSVRMIQTLNASKIWHRVYFHQLPSRWKISKYVLWWSWWTLWTIELGPIWRQQGCSCQCHKW